MIAHRRAIVSSANARVLVILMICTASADFEKQSTPSNSDVSPLTTTAATVITTLELKDASHLTRFMKSTELFGEPSFQTKHLDPGVGSRVDTSHGAKQRSGFRDSGQSGRSESTRFDTMKRSVFSQERRGRSLRARAA